MNTVLKITRRAPLAAVTAVALTGAVMAPVAGAATHAKPKPKSVTKTVKVKDDFYSPTKVTIKKGQSVNWIWSKSNFNTHTVTLIKGPKGVNKKKFSSFQAAEGVHFKLTFTKAGTYHFECQLHPLEMNMTVTVKN